MLGSLCFAQQMEARALVFSALCKCQATFWCGGVGMFSTVASECADGLSFQEVLLNSFPLLPTSDASEHPALAVHGLADVLL